MSRQLFERFPSLCGVYVTTEASIPVLNAARDAGLLDRLTIITTDLFPDLIPQIRSGAVAATIYQRPRAQGQIAFRMLHEFLAEGANRSHQVALAPHLLMRGNLDFFLQRQSQGIGKGKTAGDPRSNRRTDRGYCLAHSAATLTTQHEETFVQKNQRREPSLISAST